MNRAVFLDRDGVINAAIWNTVEGKPDTPYRLEDFRLLPGVAQAVRTIGQMGFLAVVVSNQPGMAKGKCGRELLEAVNQRMLDSMAEEAPASTASTTATIIRTRSCPPSVSIVTVGSPGRGYWCKQPRIWRLTCHGRT
jgi:histidinol phosphatase-like enzyme